MKFYSTPELVAAATALVLFIMTGYLIDNESGRSRKSLLRKFVFFACLVFAMWWTFPTFAASIFFDTAGTDQNGSTYAFASNYGLSAIRIMKFDHSGKLLWIKQYAEDEFGSYPRLLTFDPEGCIYVWTYSNPLENEDCYLLKLNPNGGLLWKKFMNNDIYDVRNIHDIHFDQDRIRIVSATYAEVTYHDYNAETGQVLSTTALSRGIVSEERYNNLDIHIDSNGDTILSAYYDTKTVLAKFDPDHQKIYEVALDNTAITHTSAAMDRQNCLYIAGSNSIEAYLEKYSPDGTLMSTNEITLGEHGETDRINIIRIAEDDSVYALVLHHKTAKPNESMYSLVKVTADGSIAWTKTIGAGNIRGRSIHYFFDLDRTGNVYLTREQKYLGLVSTVKYDTAGCRLWKTTSISMDEIRMIWLLIVVPLLSFSRKRSAKRRETMMIIEE